MESGATALSASLDIPRMTLGPEVSPAIASEILLSFPAATGTSNLDPPHGKTTFTTTTFVPRIPSIGSSAVVDSQGGTKLQSIALGLTARASRPTLSSSRDTLEEGEEVRDMPEGFHPFKGRVSKRFRESVRFNSMCWSRCL